MSTKKEKSSGITVKVLGDALSGGVTESYAQFAKRFISNFSKKTPSDEIVLDGPAIQELANIWYTPDMIGVPADIVLSDTIPLKDFVLTLPDTIIRDVGTVLVNNHLEHVGNTSSVRIRVLDEWQHCSDADFNKIALSEYFKNVGNHAKAEEAKTYESLEVDIFGAIFFYFPKRNSDDPNKTYGYSEMYIPLMVINDLAVTVLGIPIICGLTEIEEAIIRDPRGRKNYEDLLRRVQSFGEAILPIWYGVELSLLNPLLQEIHDKHSETAIFNRANTKKASKDKRRQVKYIKKHYLFGSDIAGSLDDFAKKKGFKRKTMAWYVVGHYRIYQTGKRVFIQGYWKGPMKDTKKNHDEIRLRKIETGGMVNV